jgi:FMN reductase (NADPH)
MEYDSLLASIRRRRSVRQYKEDPVPETEVMKVLEAARWAPSGNNSQPWEFVVVRDQDKRRKVTEIFVAQSLSLRQTSDNFKHAPIKDYLERISCLLFVCGDPRFIPAYPRSSASPELAEMYAENSRRIYIESVTAAICNILLAASSLGLGTVWLTGTGEKETAARLKSLLKIPEILDILSCIPLGYPPGGSPAPRSPRPLENVVHMDEFDRSKWRTDEEVDRFCNERDVWAEFFKTGMMPH